MAGSRRPAAVVFDVDGTLVDSERDGHRVAFNLAFEELGLPDRWDEQTYGALLAVTGGQRRLRAWFTERGMPAAEQETLVGPLHARKTELFLELIGDGRVPARPGARRLVDELADASVPQAVATTGTRAWVVPLLDRLFGVGRFAVVVTGDDVAARKPDPEAYRLVLDRLGLDGAGVVAVEDSDNGVRSAVAAGIAVVAVANDYTAGQELAGAPVVLDGFGMPDAPARVLRGDAGLVPRGMLDVASLARVAGAAASAGLGVTRG